MTPSFMRLFKRCDKERTNPNFAKQNVDISQRSPGPSLFANAQKFTIYGGNFTAGNFQSEHYRTDMSSNGIPEIAGHLVECRENLGRRAEWTFSTGEAEIKGKQNRVIIQTFKGSRAKELWQATIDYTQQLVDPHLPRIIGKSPTSGIPDNDPCYILFVGSAHRGTHFLIASSLRHGERETAVLGSQAIYGIASGLDFLLTLNPKISLADYEPENFEVFSEDDGKTILALTPPMKQIQNRCTVMKAPWLLGQKTLECDSRFDAGKNAFIVFDSLVSKLFNDANHVIYREKLDRCNKEDLLTGGPIARWASDALIAESKLQVVGPSVNSSYAEESACRREIVWTSLGSNRPLSDILETYSSLAATYKTGSKHYSPSGLPRRSGKRRSAARHACQGYRREEITLTPDPFQNTVMVFKMPSLHEVCPLCGRVVIRIPDFWQYDIFSATCCDSTPSI